MTMKTMAPPSPALLSSRVLAGRAFLVKTPVCILYFAYLKRWLLTGNLGAVVYGWPRLGKTSGTRWVLSAIQEVFGRLPFVEVPIRKQHLHNEGAFFQFLLKCCKHRYPGKGSVTDKRDRFLEAMLNRARRSETRTVILFIDEAHQLDELEYQWLQNISNELDAAGARLFCLLVGQHELSSKRDLLILEGFEQIVGRFMTEEWSYRGLNSAEEIKVVLAAYQDSFYPKKDSGGRPFLSYYIPSSIKNDWHLAPLAPMFWEAYQGVWKSLGGEADKLEVPMQYLTSTMIALVNQLSEKDSISLEVDIKTVGKAVSESGFRNAMLQLRRAQEHAKSNPRPPR